MFGKGGKDLLLGVRFIYSQRLRAYADRREDRSDGECLADT